MERTDISMLSERERELLDDSFQSQRLARKVRGIILSMVVAVVAMVLFNEYGLSSPWFAAVSVTVLIVSATEKLIYQRTMATYESLTKKLVRRVESLEGVPLTPDDAKPSRASERAVAS